MHLDLKPSNIFFNYGDNSVKIGDFGLARKVPFAGDYREGDRTYLAPELLLTSGENSITCLADIFSLGLILLEMVGNVELPENGPLWTQLREGAGCLDGLIMNVPHPVKDFISSMLHSDTSMRPRAVDLLDHPFLR